MAPTYRLEATAAAAVAHRDSLSLVAPSMDDWVKGQVRQRTIGGAGAASALASPLCEEAADASPTGAPAHRPYLCVLGPHAARPTIACANKRLRGDRGLKRWNRLAWYGQECSWLFGMEWS